MSPTLASIVKRLNEARERLKAARRTLQESIDHLKRHDDKFFQTTPSEVMQHRRKVLEQGVESAMEQATHLDQEVVKILAEEAAQLALEESHRLKNLKQGAEQLYQAVQKGKNLRYLGLLGLVLAVIGISGYMLYNASGDLELPGQNIGNLGQPTGPAASGNFTEQPLSGDVSTSLEPQRIVHYKLVKTKVSKQLAGEAPQESEVNGGLTSLDLATTQPGFTSTGTLSVEVPLTISSDQQSFTVSASIAASWNLKATVYNLNVAVNVIGVGKANAKGDPSPWPTAGSHSLSVESAKETSFATDGSVRKWTENGKNYRSFSVGGHTGVIQTLSGGNLTFIYEEDGSNPISDRESLPDASSTSGDAGRFSGSKVFSPGDGNSVNGAAAGSPEAGGPKN